MKNRESPVLQTSPSHSQYESELSMEVISGLNELAKTLGLETEAPPPSATPHTIPVLQAELPSPEGNLAPNAIPPSLKKRKRIPSFSSKQVKAPTQAQGPANFFPAVESIKKPDVSSAGRPEITVIFRTPQKQLIIKQQLIEDTPQNFVHGINFFLTKFRIEGFSLYNEITRNKLVTFTTTNKELSDDFLKDISKKYIDIFTNKNTVKLISADMIQLAPQTVAPSSSTVKNPSFNIRSAPASNIDVDQETISKLICEILFFPNLEIEVKETHVENLKQYISTIITTTHLTMSIDIDKLQNSYKIIIDRNNNLFNPNKITTSLKKYAQNNPYLLQFTIETSLKPKQGVPYTLPIAIKDTCLLKDYSILLTYHRQQEIIKLQIGPDYKQIVTKLLLENLSKMFYPRMVSVSSEFLEINIIIKDGQDVSPTSIDVIKNDITSYIEHKLAPNRIRVLPENPITTMPHSTFSKRL